MARLFLTAVRTPCSPAIGTDARTIMQTSAPNENHMRRACVRTQTHIQLDNKQRFSPTCKILQMVCVSSLTLKETFCAASLPRELGSESKSEHDQNQFLMTSCGFFFTEK